jgi:hypothetical protein
MSNRRLNRNLHDKDVLNNVPDNLLCAINAYLKKHYVDPHAEALSIDEFCLRYGIGRQLVYDELNAGRLIGKKVGRRTIIPRMNGEGWLNSLPTIKPKRAGEAA